MQETLNGEDTKHIVFLVVIWWTNTILYQFLNILLILRIYGIIRTTGGEVQWNLEQPIQSNLRWIVDSDECYSDSDKFGHANIQADREDGERNPNKLGTTSHTLEKKESVIKWTQDRTW